MSAPDTEQENSRLITLMLQVATMDGKLDVVTGELMRRVGELEKVNKESTAKATSIIAIIIAGVMAVITVATNWT